MLYRCRDREAFFSLIRCIYTGQAEVVCSLMALVFLATGTFNLAIQCRCMQLFA